MAEVKTNKELFNVSVSPHIRSNESVSKIMWTVNICLAPAALFGAYYFGLNAILILVAGIASAVFFEWAVQKIRKKPVTVKDGSAFLTGLLLAMGGLGSNIFNPAHIGRAALMVSWPVAMTTWSKMTTAADVVSSATPLNILKMQGHQALIDTFGNASNMYQALFLGTRNGSIGETCTVLLVLGGAFLIYKKYINWQIPVVMIGTVGVLTWIFGGLGDPTGSLGFFAGDPLFHMMAGGLIIGAFFMATDMVTIPMTIKGQMIFAFGAGLLTVLIRLKGGYPEGVCYSILLMNCLTPLIDRFCQPKKFGARG